MSDKPILFSAPMVRALIEGRKTQTRRVLKLQPPFGATVFQSGDAWFSHVRNGLGSDCVNVDSVEPRYAIGDRLWVREAWRTGKAWDDTPPRDIPPGSSVSFGADGDEGMSGRLRPGMFMPRWASRLTLVVTEVRVQRLQDISEADAVAEGIFVERWQSIIKHLENPTEADTHAPDTPVYFAPEDDSESCVCFSAKEAFERLWNIVHDGDIYCDAWAENPWVAAYTFTVHRCNIDAMP